MEPNIGRLRSEWQRRHGGWEHCSDAEILRAFRELPAAQRAEYEAEIDKRDSVRSESDRNGNAGQ